MKQQECIVANTCIHSGYFRNRKRINATGDDKGFYRNQFSINRNNFLENPFRKSTKILLTWDERGKSIEQYVSDIKRQMHQL